MKLLEYLIKKPNIFQRTVGLSPKQFELLAKQLVHPWKKAEKQRKMSTKRKRKIGGGRPYKLMNLKLKLLTVLVYYKSYSTQEFLGILIGLDQANVSRLLAKMRPLIESAADLELATYLSNVKKEYEQLKPQQRINDWHTFIQRHPDLKDVATDATEQQCYRSKNNVIQKKYYSGKKKLHTLKTQISVSMTGKILDISGTYPGSIHDKKVIAQEQTVQKFPEKTCQRFDSGYQGVLKENPNHYVVTPIKKPHKTDLSFFAKDLNTSHSKRRIIVENILSRLKKFKICKYTFRGPINTYNQTFRSISALLNFRLNNPSII